MNVDYMVQKSLGIIGHTLVPNSSQNFTLDSRLNALNILLIYNTFTIRVITKGCIPTF
jgi:hypothetical protein